MAKIADWTEESRRTVTIAVEGITETLKGQGAFEILPEELEIVFESWGKGEPEAVFKIKVRGVRMDSGKDLTNGLRVWFPGQESHKAEDVPVWVRELIEVFTRYTDLDDQLRVSVIAARWLTGFDPAADRYEASKPGDVS